MLIDIRQKLNGGFQTQSSQERACSPPRTTHKRSPDYRILGHEKRDKTYTSTNSNQWCQGSLRIQKTLLAIAQIFKGVSTEPTL